MEHRKRSLLKTLSWRTFSFMLTVTILYAYTKDIRQSLGVGFGIDFVKMILYYYHERIWNKVHYGRRKIADYQI